MKVSCILFSLAIKAHVLLGRELGFANKIPTLSELIPQVLWGASAFSSSPFEFCCQVFLG